MVGCGRCSAAWWAMGAAQRLCKRSCARRNVADEMCISSCYGRKAVLGCQLDLNTSAAAATAATWRCGQTWAGSGEQARSLPHKGVTGSRIRMPRERLIGLCLRSGCGGTMRGYARCGANTSRDDGAHCDLRHTIDAHCDGMVHACARASGCTYECACACACARACACLCACV